jgi:hypothetical protein
MAGNSGIVANIFPGSPEKTIRATAETTVTATVTVAPTDTTEPVNPTSSSAAGSTAPTPQTSAGGSAVGSTADPYAYHAGSAVVVPNGTWIDLDAPPSDPGWHPVPDPLGLTQATGDLLWAGTELRAYSRVQFSIVDIRDAEPCLAVYNTSPIPASRLSSGIHLCVLTSQGRLSLLTVREATSGSITLDIKTRKKNTDS